MLYWLVACGADLECSRVRALNLCDQQAYFRRSAWFFRLPCALSRLTGHFGGDGLPAERPSSGRSPAKHRTRVRVSRPAGRRRNGRDGCRRDWCAPRAGDEGARRSRISAALRPRIDPLAARDSGASAAQDFFQPAAGRREAEVGLHDLETRTGEVLPKDGVGIEADDRGGETRGIVGDQGGLAVD